MPDLIVYLPNHGYDDDDPVYVSWLNDTYYVSDKGDDSFKLATTLGGAILVQYDETITDGYVREVAGSGVTSISNLHHLEGKIVKVTTGGEVVATETVSSGSITLATTVYTYQVGLPYKMKVRTMRLSVPQEGNTIQSRIKRIHETTVRYINSIYGKAGQEYDGTEYLEDLNAVYDDESRDATVLTKGGFSEEAYTVITSDEPTPFTVLATIISFEVAEQR